MRKLPLFCLFWLMSLNVIANPQPIFLGEDMLGQICQLQEHEDRKAIPGIPIDLKLYCNQHFVSNGISYFKVQPLNKTDKSENQQQLLFALFKNTPLFNTLNTRAICNTAHWLSTDDQNPVAILPCQLKNAGWQQVIMITIKNDILSLAEAPPSTAGLLLKFFGVSASVAEKFTFKEQLNQLWNGPVVLVSASDLEEFRLLLRDGRSANNNFNFAIAETLFRRALGLQTKFLPAEDLAIAHTLLDLALNASNQDKTNEAQALLRRAENILQKSPFEADRARLAYYQGIEAANRGDMENALQFAKQATATWRKISNSAINLNGLNQTNSTTNLAEKGELILSLNFEAIMSLRNDSITAASAAASEALLLLTQSEGLPNWWRADIMQTLGEISIAQGRLSAAETYFNSALTLRRQSFGDGVGSVLLLTALGRAYQSEGLNSAAILAYREAFELANGLNLGADTFTPDQLIPFAQAIVEYIATITDKITEQALYDEAFEAFQNIRSPIVDKTIAKAQARLVNQDPTIATLIEKTQTTQRNYDSAKAELAIEQALPDDERSSTVETRLQANILRLEQENNSLQTEINQKFPTYTQLSNPKPIALEQVRNSLSEKEAIVSFLVGRKQSFIQVTRKQGNFIAKINEGMADIEDNVKALRRGLEIQNGGLNEFDLNGAHALYKTLFLNVQSYLNDVDHLIVAAQGPLANLPFGLLITEPNKSFEKSTEYTQAAWLSKRMAISYVPSVQAFYKLRNTSSKNKPSEFLLAFGDPVLNGQNFKNNQNNTLDVVAKMCNTDGPIHPHTLRSMAALPETTREIKTIANVLGSKKTTLFLREQASENILRSQRLENYRILYFATHGLLPGELKCQTEPGLVLTPPKQTNSKNNDGLLEASEIATFKLNADLVVLSACNTASGGGKFGGEALSGLAESFFFAGARNLVVSHWQVPSEATANLLSNMFITLGPELQGGASAALRKAQLTLIEQKKTAHPFFWAAFVVVGDGLVIENPPSEHVQQTNAKLVFQVPIK